MQRTRRQWTVSAPASALATSALQKLVPTMNQADAMDPASEVVTMSHLGERVASAAARHTGGVAMRAAENEDSSTPVRGPITASDEWWNQVRTWNTAMTRAVMLLAPRRKLDKL